MSKTKSKTIFFIYVILCITALYGCKKEEDKPHRHFTVTFWTEDGDGYPLQINILKDYGVHFDALYIGTLSTHTTGPITNCNSINTLTVTIDMDAGGGWDAVASFHGCYTFFNSPFYAGTYYQNFVDPSYYENTCTIVKIENTTHKKVTLWTSNAGYVQGGNYLSVKESDNGYKIGEIRKSFSSAPNCGADSTFNSLLLLHTTNRLSIYLNDTTFIDSLNFTVPDSACMTIEIP